jgi:ribosomal protein L16/L10AE
LLINHSAGLLLFPEYEALRRILSRKLIRLLRFSLFVHPYAMVTAKPREIRMGKGKGAFSHFALPTKVGSFFAKIFWCQTQNFCPLFFATRNALKKSGQKFTI